MSAHWRGIGAGHASRYVCANTTVNPAPLFSLAGLSNYYGTGDLSTKVYLQKLRTDYPEFALYSAMSRDGTRWARWYFTNRSAPSNLVYKIDDAVIDFASGAIGATWTGNLGFALSYTTNLLFPSDSTQFATFSYSGSITRDGYRVDSTRTITAQVRIFEDYALMLNVPSTQSGTQGIGGGFKTFAAVGDTQTTRTYQANNDSNNALGAPVSMAMWFNATYAVIGMHQNYGNVRTAMASYRSGDQTALSFVQDRSDKFVKWYNRSCFGDSSAGFLIDPGNSYRSVKLYRPMVRE